jgi:hypothetical protein
MGMGTFENGGLVDGVNDNDAKSRDANEQEYQEMRENFINESVKMIIKDVKLKDQLNTLELIESNLHIHYKNIIRISELQFIKEAKTYEEFQGLGNMKDPSITEKELIIIEERMKRSAQRHGEL